MILFQSKSELGIFLEETTKIYNILIVEDDFINAQFLQKAVVKLGHRVVGCIKSGQEAIDAVKNQEVHIAFMDINLEGAIDGIRCAKQINQKQNIPIIYTTAFGDSQTISEATDTNLYGYLIKPFDFADVEAALKLTIKQNYAQDTKPTPTSDDGEKLGNGYRYYPQTKTLIKNNRVIDLTNRESLLFEHFYQNCNQNLTNEYLAFYVWSDESVAASTIRNAILRLRKKIPDIEIVTLQGVGYRLQGC